MDYSKLTLFQMMQTKMAYLSERQDVLSHNIANIDTPGYKARDLKKLDFKRLAEIATNRLQMRMTAAEHSTGTPKMPKEFRDEKTRHAFESKKVENNVVVEEQMAKVNETNMEYEKTTNLYKKTTDMFKTAIGKN